MDTETSQIYPYQAFGVLDIRVDRITRAEINKKACIPAYKLWIDLGKLGERTSSAQITGLYQPKDLIGRFIVAAAIRLYMPERATNDLDILVW